MPGTVKPCDDFNAEAAAEKLMKAMKGLGTDEDSIIDVLARHDNEQRQQIKAYYQTAYGNELADDLKSELGGHFEDVVLGLLMTPIEWDVYWLHRAVKGLGTDESCLVELLVARDFPEIDAMKAGFKEKYEDDLDEKLQSELSRDFCRLVRGILACGGECAGDVDCDRAKEDAQALLDAGSGAGTDEMKFISILNTRAFPQLRATFDQFQELAGKSIEEYLASEFSGSLKEGLITYVQRINDTPGYFAERLRHGTKGAGTDDKTLIRIIVARSEIDLQDIKEKFQEKYEESLAEVVAGETSGDYKELLVKLVGE